MRLDNKLRPQVSLSREILVFRRIAVFAEYEFQADFGWVNDLSEGENFEKEEVFTVGAEYFPAKTFPSWEAMTTDLVPGVDLV